MCRRPASHLALILSVLVSISAAPEPQKKATDPKDEQIAVLNRLYADALDHNQTLTQKVQQLNQQVTTLQARLVMHERRTPGFGQVPPDWKLFDFNGSRVYLVPLGMDRAPVSKTRRR